MKYWCWRPEDKAYINFGDELTGLLLERIFPNEKHEWVDPEEAEIVAVGSVLRNVRPFLRDGTAIWGSGGGYEPEDVERLNVLAVRGPVTVENCELPRDTPIGDPALLLPLYVQPSEKKYKLGLVRHIADDRLHELVDADIEITCDRPPLEVIADITSCEMIISSSLHGWIVAFAYGIPCVPMPLDEGYKFTDFMMSLREKSLEEMQRDLLDTICAYRGII